MEQNMKTGQNKSPPQGVPEKCDRCSAKLDVSIMSKFNVDTLCDRCADDERLAPGYAAASQAEMAAVRNGDMNFPGVGLSSEDQAFLTQRLKVRKRH
jgi:hypothetical protein